MRLAPVELAQLQRITREPAIALKANFERSVAQNVAHAYLGKRAGQAVLNGSIRRGDGEKISAEAMVFAARMARQSIIWTNRLCEV